MTITRLHPIDELTAIVECSRLQTEYCRLFDAGEIAAWSQLFTADAIWAIDDVARIEGRDTLFDHFSKVPSAAFVHHLNFNGVVNLVDGESARGAGSCAVLRGLDRQTPQSDIAGVDLVEYRDQYRREAAGWRLRAREMVKVAHLPPSQNNIPRQAFK